MAVTTSPSPSATQPSSAPSTTLTACTLDCPDACSLQVTVEDGRITKIEGDERNPLTAGFLCSKVRRFDRHVYSTERLLQPMRRVGPRGQGDFEPISWDEALDQVAERLRKARDEHGGESILPFSYGGSNGALTQDALDARLFRRLGASRLAYTVCAAPSSRAAQGLYGKFPGIAPEDYVHSKMIVVWGANPSASSIHHVPVIREAQRRGAKLVVVDPRAIPLARQADLHLALRPGSDLALAMALIRWFFVEGRADLDFLDQHATGVEELRQRAEPWTFERAADVTGLSVDEIETFAHLYADGEPAALRCGWGQERNRNGGSASAAILALPAVAGKFGRRGGGYTMSNTGAWNLDLEALDGEPEPETRIVNMNRLGTTLHEGDPRVQLLFVYNCNPLTTLPDQEKVRAGLEREDLYTVVFEQVMTDTARYADLLLPATTFLEHRDLRPGYGSMALQSTRPAIEPQGEARSNVQVFRELIERLGLGKEGDLEAEDVLERALLEDAGYDGPREDLAQRRISFRKDGGRPVQFVDNFPRTPDQKIHLVPEDLDQEAPHGLYAFQNDPATEDFPLALLSPATRKTVSSTFGQLHRGQVPLEMDPVDAARRNLVDGDRVRVWNDLGEVRCQVRITKDLRPGTTVLPKGIWAHNTENGRTSNALVASSYTDLGEGACFNDARVQVEKLS